MEAPTCPSCESDNVVTDARQGHLVCDDCGVILESSMISTATEYRNFSESDKPTGDPHALTTASQHRPLPCISGQQAKSGLPCAPAWDPVQSMGCLYHLSA